MDQPSRLVEGLPWLSDRLSKNYSGRASGTTKITLSESAYLVKQLLW